MRGRKISERKREREGMTVEGGSGGRERISVRYKRRGARERRTSRGGAAYPTIRNSEGSSPRTNSSKRDGNNLSFGRSPLAPTMTMRTGGRRKEDELVNREEVSRA